MDAVLVVADCRLSHKIFDPKAHEKIPRRACLCHRTNSNRYEATILANDELEMVLDSTEDADGDPELYIRHSDTSKFVFIGLPIIGAAALGGLYEALWKRREISSAGGGGHTGVEVQEEVDDRPGILAFLHNVVHYQYRPLGRYSP